MRAVAVAVLLVALVLGLGTLSVIHTLLMLDDRSGPVVAGIMEGDVHLLYLRADTWSNVPRALAATRVSGLLHLESLLSIGGTAALLLWLCRRNGWRQYALVGVGCLVSALAPWLVGRTVILTLEDPLQIRQWLWWMVLSTFWACVACAALAFWQLLQGRRREPAAEAPLAEPAA